MEDLAALVAANEDTAAAIAAAYEVLLGGVPNVEGFTFLIDNAVATNYGSDDDSVVFNQENIFINIVNSLVKGNAVAEASFDALIGGASTLTDAVTALYQAMVPTSLQSAEGLAYLTRPEALAFYQQVAEERGVAGTDGAAIVALASILNIAYENDTPGIGDSVNDLLAAIYDNTADLPLTGNDFTPIEDADGLMHDDDDGGPATILTTAPDTFNGSAADDRIEAPVVQTALLPNQTLNSGDRIDGGGGRDTVHAQLVDFLVQPAELTSIEHLSLENAPIALGLAAGPRVVDAINADAIEEVTFRSPNANIITGLGVTNVSTVVDIVNIESSGIASLTPVNHFITFIGDALDGDEDSVEINLDNVANTTLTLAGAYEMATINSNGPTPNSFALAIATLEELTILGNQDLFLGDLEIDPLALVDAGAFEGDLIARFVNDQDAGLDGVNDVITVIGGLGDDDLTFGSINDFDSDVTVSSGAGDDFITFNRVDGKASFGAADSADGGEGTDELWIDVVGGSGNQQELLVDGVGANIIDIERIVHFAAGISVSMNDDLLVDWTRSGSAMELELAADYDDQDVFVTGLTNDDMVIVTGDDLRDLSLTSLNGGGSLSNEINLLFEVPAIGDRIDIHRDLIVDADTEMLNLHTTGLGYVEIDGADLIESDITIESAADLSLGEDDGVYDLANGTIDGSTSTGNLTIALGAGYQQVSGGSGDDLIIVTDNTTNNIDHIFLAAGGNDTVWYDEVVSNAGGEALNAMFNPQINGFATSGDGSDIIQLDVPTLGLEDLNANALAGNAVVVQDDIETGLAYNISADVNFLKFTDAFTGAATTSVQNAYLAVIAGGTIQAAGGAGDVDILASYYDATNEQAVLIHIDGGGQVVDNADTAQLITTIGMSQAEYDAFGADNIAFV